MLEPKQLRKDIPRIRFRTAAASRNSGIGKGDMVVLLVRAVGAMLLPLLLLLLLSLLSVVVVTAAGVVI